MATRRGIQFAQVGSEDLRRCGVSLSLRGRASGSRHLGGVSQAASGGVGGLFTQALLLCEKAGLVKLGHVSIDGTKIKANASKHKAMSYGGWGGRGAVEGGDRSASEAAEATDTAEDAQYARASAATSCRWSWRGGRAV